MTVIARRLRILGKSFQKLTIVRRISASASYLSSMKKNILNILNDNIDYKWPISVNPGINEIT